MTFIILFLTASFAQACDIKVTDVSTRQTRQVESESVKSVLIESNQTTLRTTAGEVVVSENAETVFRKVNACKNPPAKNRGNVSKVSQ